MTNKTISTTVHGYKFAASNTNLTITATGKITRGSTSAALYGAANRANETVLNLGTVGDTTSLYGIVMKDGATITNGSATDKTAAIVGSSIGIRIDGKPGTVTNFGSIRADSAGIKMFAGGTVTNGSAADTTAKISAGSDYEAVHINYGVGKVTNFGAIVGTVGLYGGGAITNQASGKITGMTAIYLAGGSLTNTTLKNLGTITGHVLMGTGNIINGSASDRTATISVNSQGVSLETGTIINFGTITATSDVLAADGDTIIAEAGSKLIGAASYAQNATLVFGSAGGAGTITGLGSGTITGSTSGKFRELTTYEIQAGGAWTLSGANNLKAGESLTIKGTLSLAGPLGGSGKVSIASTGAIKGPATGVGEVKTAIANAGLLLAAGGTLKLDKAVTGAGSAHINNGTLVAAGAFNENVQFTGTTGRLELDHSRTYVGKVSGFAHGMSLDLRDISFVSASEVTFTGTASGGTLTVNDGTHTAKIKLVGNYIGDTFKATGDGNGGTTIVDTTAPSTPHFVAAMATMGGAAGGHAPPKRDPAPTPPLLAHPRT
jgi:hypothetical protein